MHGHRFNASELAEIDAAVRHAQKLGRNMDTLRVEDFPLPTVSPHLERARDYLEEGAGLHLFRGIPVDRYSKDELRFLFWGMGKHVGTAVSQSSRGDVLGDVRNIGEDMRMYTSNLDGPFHGDTTDVVGLFVVRTSKSGGLSIGDADSLLRATASQAGEAVAAARTRIHESMEAAKKRLTEVSQLTADKAKHTAKATDQFVHQHPWQAVGIGAALGVVLGMLISRR